MGRLLLFIVIGAVIVGLWARSALVEKKKAQEAMPPEDEPAKNKVQEALAPGEVHANDEPTELNKHPERLNQMLDPTDDA